MRTFRSLPPIRHSEEPFLLAGERLIRFVKVGNRTLIDLGTVRRYLAGQAGGENPSATVGDPEGNQRVIHNRPGVPASRRRIGSKMQYSVPKNGPHPISFWRKRDFSHAKHRVIALSNRDALALGFPEAALSVRPISCASVGNE
jgi:hypothetical protein